jgi:DNA-binding NarL/FixJ family response regulator
MAEQGGRPRVLVADDYPGWHSVITRLLAPECDVLGCVSDGADLLDAVERLRPTVVVLDVRMPGIRGLDGCRQLKAAAPDLRVIVFTAADDPELRVQALEAGASAFVAKVRAADELMPAIQKSKHS